MTREATEVIDLTFVDAPALILFASSSTKLDSALDFTVNTLVSFFRKYKSKINWRKWETDAMLHYRGKHEKASRRVLISSTTNSKHVEADDIKLSVVESYKHLG